MKSILKNPFRTLGLLAGVSPREQTKQISRLKKYIEAEQYLKDDYSFPALGNLDRNTESVEEAVSKLDLDKDKIKAALFWFWNGNPITDDAAFEYLKSGDINAANEIWGKLIIKTDDQGKRFWKQVTEKNYSAFHNYSVLNLIRANGNLHNAIVSKIYFLESELIHNFVSSVSDKTFKINKKDLQLLFLNQILEEIKSNNRIDLSKFFEIINKQEFVSKSVFINSFVNSLIEQIESKIEKAKNKRKASKEKAAEAGQDLFSTTTSELLQLKNFIGENDLKFVSISDKVANEILQCSIDFFNDSQEKESSSDYHEIAMKLAKQAESIAVGKLTKDRVSDNIRVLEELKDKELLQAIGLLQSIKDAYEEACRQIDEQVDELQYFTIGTVKIPRLNVSINWSKVEEMKRNCLAWDVVTNLILEAIPLKNIEKIKQSQNVTKVNEYKILVNFILNLINYPLKKRIEYLNYWEPLKQKSSSYSEGCYIATMVYGSYEHPQVLELRKFRDEILKKNLVGRVFIKAYYLISPKLTEILQNKRVINNLISKSINLLIKIIKK